MRCSDCGAGNAEGMTKCGNCGKPLPSDESVEENQGDGRRGIEERWNRVMSANGPHESVEEGIRKPGAASKDLELASKILIAALVFLALGFILQVYSNEKVEGLYSGDLTEMMEVFDDLEGISKAAKWAGYLQTFGLILLAAGLVGMTVGLSKHL